jgi:uncharacterized protein (TIGR00255 family)
MTAPVMSMTGFGRSEGGDGRHQLTVEIRSLNHRSLQWKGRFPPHAQELEAATDVVLRKHLARGAIHLSVEIRQIEKQPGVSFDEDMAILYKAKLDVIADRLGYENPPRLEYVLGLPGVVERIEEEPEMATLLGLYEKVLSQALEMLVEGRKREGEILAEELRSRSRTIQSCVERIESRLPLVKKDYQERLEKRIREYLDARGHAVEEVELLREVAIYADKSDVAEELSRLRTHIDELNRILDEGGPLGRRLDFLGQEMLREINTTGSKSADSELAHLVVEVKAELERIKEQSQNLE